MAPITTAFTIHSAAAGSIKGTSGQEGSDHEGSGGNIHAGGAVSALLSVLTPAAFMPGGPLPGGKGEAAATAAPLPDHPPKGGEREVPAPLPARRRAIEDGFLALPNR